MSYTLTAHAAQRIVERGIKENDLARALCRPPTYHLARKRISYFDPESGTAVIVAEVAAEQGDVTTVYRAGE